jgi:hypothetical protein
MGIFEGLIMHIRLRDQLPRMKTLIARRLCRSAMRGVPAEKLTLDGKTLCQDRQLCDFLAPDTWRPSSEFNPHLETKS